jgi:putative transposase
MMRGQWGGCREVPKTLCGCKKAGILEGAACTGHVRLCLSVPPKTGVSGFMGCLKGKSAPAPFDRRPECGGKRSRKLRAGGCRASAAGNLDGAQIGKCVEDQESVGKSRKQEPLLEAAGAGLAAPVFKARKRHAALFAF